MYLLNGYSNNFVSKNFMVVGCFIHAGHHTTLGHLGRLVSSHMKDQHPVYMHFVMKSDCENLSHSPYVEKSGHISFLHGLEKCMYKCSSNFGNRLIDSSDKWKDSTSVYLCVVSAQVHTRIITCPLSIEMFLLNLGVFFVLDFSVLKSTKDSRHIYDHS